VSQKETSVVADGIWYPVIRRGRAQSEAVFNETMNSPMCGQLGSNEIYIVGLPEKEEHDEETDTGDEPL
jgi:hypothetical protein